MESVRKDLLDSELDGIELLLSSNDYDENDPAWDIFIDQIIEGNVIPVIGPDILCEKGNPHQTILNYFIKIFGVKGNVKSFTELIYDPAFTANNRQRDYIYSYINQFLFKCSKHKFFIPSQLLRDILSIKQFPFVITTSFIPVVEEVMRDIWHDNLKVMCFNNNPSENQDIKDEIDLHNPTVYYMFGKVGDSAHRYVVTDIDMLDFCSSWIADTEGRPSKLVSSLGKKYLLMIGNSYSDWLFRFIWYSLRKSGTGGGLYACEDIDDDLSRFLQRNQTFLRKPPKEVINIMRRKLETKLSDKKRNKFASVQYYADVFISYSRAASEIAQKLYDALTQRGINVWYDRNNITRGGKFMDEIFQGIRTAKYFIPVLTLNVEEETKAQHVYREEWDEAMRVGIRYGRTYIIPISEKGLDFYHAAIPDRLRQHNAIEFESINDIENVASLIIEKLKL